jgi:hypothetical protein
MILRMHGLVALGAEPDHVQPMLRRVAEVVVSVQAFRKTARGAGGRALQQMRLDQGRDSSVGRDHLGPFRTQALKGGSLIGPALGHVSQSSAFLGGGVPLGETVARVLRLSLFGGVVTLPALVRTLPFLLIGSPSWSRCHRSQYSVVMS